MAKSKDAAVNAYVALMNQWVAKRDNEHTDRVSLDEIGRLWALLTLEQKKVARAAHNTNGRREAHG